MEKKLKRRKTKMKDNILKKEAENFQKVDTKNFSAQKYTRKDHIKQGMISSLPIIVGYLPVGMAFAFCQRQQKLLYGKAFYFPLWSLQGPANSWP